MRNNSKLIVTLLVYGLTAASLVLGLSLPTGDSFLERSLMSLGLPAYSNGDTGLYIPGAQLFIVILMCWVMLKWLYRNQVSLWKNGLLLLIVFVVILWKVIIY